MVWDYLENLTLKKERLECNLGHLFGFLPEIQLDPEKSPIFIAPTEAESIRKPQAWAHLQVSTKQRHTHHLRMTARASARRPERRARRRRPAPTASASLSPPICY